MDDLSGTASGKRFEIWEGDYTITLPCFTRCRWPKRFLTIRLGDRLVIPEDVPQCDDPACGVCRGEQGR